MRVLLLLVVATTLLYCVAAEKCYKYGLVDHGCGSDEAEVRSIRAAPGPAGKDGEKGNPCDAAKGHSEALKNALKGTAQTAKKNFDQLLEGLKQVAELKQQLIDSINSAGGGGSGFNDNLQTNINNIRYRFFNADVSHPEALQMCDEDGGQLAFLNLLTSAERRATLMKLKLPPGTSYWVNGITGYSSVIKLSPTEAWSNIWLRKDLHRRFGFFSISSKWWKNSKKPGCLLCQGHATCRIADCFEERAKVICQYMYATPPGPVKKIIAFNTKLTFGHARHFCQRIGGELAFKVLKDKKLLSKYVRSVYQEESYFYAGSSCGLWMGGRLVPGSIETFTYLDGTPLTDIYKFPFRRPAQPTGVYLFFSYMFGNRQQGFRFDRNVFRNRRYDIGNHLATCLCFDTKINKPKKSIAYGVGVAECFQQQPFLCEFTKPMGNDMASIYNRNFMIGRGG